MTTSLDILLREIRADQSALIENLAENETLKYDVMRSTQGQIKAMERIAQRITELKNRNEEEEEDF